MKKLLLLPIFLLLLSGCRTEVAPPPETDKIAGYIVVEGDTLYVDEVELITSDMTERACELGL